MLFKEFQEQLRNSKRIVALVGAGLSASSGLPTFRGSQGLWKNFNLIDLATPDAFDIDPGLVWQFYSWRRSKSFEAQPNNGHRALAKLARSSDVDFLTISQNVDGLLIRAGHPRNKLMEIHGTLADLKCTSLSCNYVSHNNFDQPLTPALADTEDEFEGDKKDASLFFSPVKQIPRNELPVCPVCKNGSLLRPGVVWFGEMLPVQALNQIEDFFRKGPVDLILVVGTSGTVYPANSYVNRVRNMGGKVAIFNTDIEEDIVDAEEGVWGFKGDAALLLPAALNPLISEL